MAGADEAKPKDNNQLLREVLDELVSHNPDILSALVVSDDGLNVASGIPHEDDDTVALVASDLIDMAEEFSSRLAQGRLNRILLEGENRTTVVVNAGSHTVLAVLIPADAKLGLVTLSMRQAANTIASIFD
ncbi:MAG: roadblock/LC7 domain-containing protein [Anaerolineales bacterium]|nr:roadblock/LC7 domain-containing protein [Anaerolineales bacterium]